MFKQIKKLKLLILYTFIITIFSSCVVYKDGYDNLISNTITYQKLEEPSFRKFSIKFPDSEIILNSTATSIEWTCPAPTVVPSALISNIPYNREKETLRCIAVGGCDTYSATAIRQKSSDKWSIEDDKVAVTYTQNAIVQIYNNTINSSGDTKLSIICVPKSQVDYWE
ncbi:hypothetical protein [Francisella philomiragia]|uniref:Putative lipoprotein n=1 Tax=Francisella philomiragia TaxID=28110 RepID=A0A0B6CTK7_9GAMM|nr:hypothetical protein [Francisella philomiragia]AJI53814.1 putative lipoprotein [Francisella philomiragia]